MPCVLALDAGTTSVRALLFDDQTRVLAVAQREFGQHYPRPGWVEHDAEEIATAQFDVAREALSSAGLTAADVAALGITNQRETTVVWDRRTGRPIGPAIVWQDRRTADWCEALRAAGREPDIQRRTGLLLDSYFSAGKLAWILARTDADPRHLAFGTVDSWLVWRLTGEHVTDPSNASRTMLCSLATGDWDRPLAESLRIPPAILPAIRPSSGVHAPIRGVPGLDGILVAGLAGDQQAALFGQGCLAPGTAKCTYGTGCFLLQQTGERAVRSTRRLLTTIAWRLGDRLSYALEGSVFVGGATIQWLRDGLGLIATSAQVNDLAATVPDAGGVLLVPAFCGLGAPHWDPHARGAIVGLTQETTGAHLARAALDGIAFQVADVLEAMDADTGAALGELRVDGGASRSDLLLQIQADLLGVPVARPRQVETTALGAAYLAGLAVGVWDESAVARPAIDRVFEPGISRDEAAAHRAVWRRAVARASGWAG